MIQADRRGVILGTAAAFVSTAAATASERPPAFETSSNWPNDMSPLDGLIKVRNRAGGGRVFWHYEGIFYGKVQDEIAVPLMRIEGASISRAVRRSDGSYEWSLVEAGYFLDFKTGKLLKEWRNPFNNKVVVPKHYKSAQTSLFANVGEGGIQPIGIEMPPEMQFQGNLSGPTIHSDVVWFGEELLVRIPEEKFRGNGSRPPGAPSIRSATSLATWQASLSEVLDNSLDFIPSTLNYTTINSWRPWMEMGDTPGVISWKLLGSKHQSYDTIPEQLVSRLETDYPGFFLENT